MARKSFNQQMEDEAKDYWAKQEAKRAEQKAALKDRAKGGDLASKEGGALGGDSTNVGSDERGAASKYRPGKSKKKKSGGSGIFSRRNKLIGGGLGGSLLALLVMLPVVLKPFEFIHLSQLLQRNFASMELMADQRIGRHMAAFEWKGAPNRYVGSRLGTITNRVSNKIEARLKGNGVELVFTPDTGVLVGVRVDGKMVAEFDGSDRNGFRRQVSRAEIGKKMGWNKATTAIMTRIPFKRYDINLRVFGNVKRSFDERAQKWLLDPDDVRDHRIEKTGDTSFNFEANRSAIEALEERIADPNTPADEVARLEAELDELTKIDTGSPVLDAASEGYDEIDGTHNERLANAALKFEAAANTVGGASIITMMLALSCLIDTLSQEDQKAMFEKVVLPLMKMSGEALAIGGQLQAGDDVSYEELKIYNESLYDDSTINGNSWVESEGFGGEIEIPTEYKPSSQETPTVLKVLSSVEGMLDLLGIGLVSENAFVCSVATNPWVGWTLFAGEAILGILSAGTGFLTVQSAKSTVQLAIKELVSDFIVGKAINAGSSYVLSSMIGHVVPALAKGALYGSILSVGSHHNANEAARSSGGLSLSQLESAALDEHLRELRIEESKERGFAYRYFDTHNPDSLISAVYQSLSGKSLKQSPNSLTNIASATGNNITNVLNGTAFAQETTNYEQDLGSKKIAFSLEEVFTEDEILSDPFAIEAIITDPNTQQVRPEISARFEACLKSPADSFRQGNYDELEEFWLAPMPGISGCDYPETEEDVRLFTMYRLYTFDLQNILSLACLEGDYQSCHELGLDEVIIAEGNPGLTAGASIVGDPYTNSTGVACASGTIDLGVQEAWVRGTQVDMRMCAVTNIKSTGQESTAGNTYYVDGAAGNAIVNSRMSGAWYSLAEAAKTEGITVSATQSYRTHEHQTAICRRNPGCMDRTDNSAAAYPGTSSHQAGVAIDLAGISNRSVSGQSCAEGVRQTDSSKLYEWMFNNAYKFGLKQYSAEAWHWDANTLANRCGEPTWAL